MWFKVVKDFGHRKAGEVIELKEDAQHGNLIKGGFLKETTEPKSKVKPVYGDSSYSINRIVNADEKVKAENSEDNSEVESDDEDQNEIITNEESEISEENQVSEDNSEVESKPKAKTGPKKKN